jgi:hypothetical protein
VTWLRRHAWWGLLLVTLLLVAFGVTDVFVGPAADRGIPLGLTGMSIEQLEAESPSAYRLFDFFTRVNGNSLVMIGLLASAILLFGFRLDQRWAWWTMWVLPIWAIGAATLYLIAGVVPDQPPPPPLVSGPIIAVLCIAILLVSAPRFFGGTR